METLTLEKREPQEELEEEQDPGGNDSLLSIAPYSDDGDGEPRGNVHGGREEEEEDEDRSPPARAPPGKRKRLVEVRRDCPYLDTVNRQVLDFDFEKFCSISLSNLNVYACLVCGKYYQGRGRNSHAYTHSLEAGHHVYINLQTENVYCLPDGYEINDPSLDDIQHVLNPRFNNEQVLHIDENRQWSRALDGSNYLPGMGELEVVKEIQKKRLLEKKENGDDQNKTTFAEGDGLVRETSKVPFLMLGLDLPPPPLFKDAMEKDIIPQVPLFNILKKFDGETITEVVRPSITRMRYRVTRLPKYLILHMRWFTKNNFFVEKNPTLVNFPVKNLELKPLSTPKVNDKLRSKYDLIANIVHDGKPGEGYYRVFVQRKSEEMWYEMQDLHVTETLPQMVALSEAYMQIYEQQHQ